MKVIDLNEAKANLEGYAEECQQSPVIVTVGGIPKFELVPINTDDPSSSTACSKKTSRFAETPRRADGKRTRVASERRPTSARDLRLLRKPKRPGFRDRSRPQNPPGHARERHRIDDREPAFRGHHASRPWRAAWPRLRQLRARDHLDCDQVIARHQRIVQQTGSPGLGGGRLD